MNIQVPREVISQEDFPNNKKMIFCNYPNGEWYVYKVLLKEFMYPVEFTYPASCLTLAI